MLSKEEALKGVKLFVLDMDGTVYLGDQLIEGSLDFIRQVEASDDMDFLRIMHPKFRQYMSRSFIRWDWMWMKARSSQQVRCVQSS